MKINIKNKNINIDKINEIVNGFEEVKSVKIINKNSILIIGKTYEGSRIFVNKKYIYIIKQFGSGANYRIFFLSILILGILLPLVAYYIFWFPKINKFTKLIYQKLTTEIQKL